MFASRKGPFSEFTGYASVPQHRERLCAERIQMRHDAMFHSIASGTASDHILISCVAREGGDLELAAPQPAQCHRRAHVPTITCGAFMAIIQMKKTAEGQPQQAIMAAFGTEMYCQIVVVVDEDVDIFNLR